MVESCRLLETIAAVNRFAGHVLVWVYIALDNGDGHATKQTVARRAETAT